MEEIKYNQHLREYERGFRTDAPGPAPQRPQPGFSPPAQPQAAMGRDLADSTIEQHVEASLRSASYMKDKSVSSAPGQGGATNRTTVPSQLAGGGQVDDQSTTSMRESNQPTAVELR